MRYAAEMRSLHVLVSFVVLSAASAVASAEPIVFLPPIGESPAATELGYLMHMHAEHMLVEKGERPVVGLRQILSAADTLTLAPEAFAGPHAARLAGLVGTNRFIVAKLVGKAAPYTLELRVFENGKPAPVAATVLPRSSVAAVNAGARALASLGAGHAVTPATELPSDIKDDAMASYASCGAALLQQAIALDSPIPLQMTALERAIATCRNTIALYPQLDDARAKLGLALALANRAQEAVDLLRTVTSKHYEPSLWIAHYWLATRHKSHEAGLAVLQEVVRRFPSSLLARGFLSDHLYAMRRYDEALVVANALLALVPESAVARTRVSAILGRLGRNDEALRMAEEVAKKAPQDPRNLTTLASRYLDAGRYADALATLKDLEPASARVLNLRGWALLRLNKLDDAQRAFELARTATDAAPFEWRTRGRVFAGLLRVAAARNDQASSAKLAEQIKLEGFVAFTRAMQDPAVTAALDRAHMPVNDAAPATKPKVTGPRYIRPSEATPFSLDPTGDIDPRGRALTSPPNQLELLRY